MFKRLFNLFVFGLGIDAPTVGSAGAAVDDPPKVDDPKIEPKTDDSLQDDKQIDNKIPYDRFKKVNEENKALKAQIEKEEKAKTQAEKKRLED